ncbi:MAG: TonB C-terminal domain-containing protein [Deltaproteobacteria bacterium]|nr:TonB C-terminal domain-containing protein [Deltaproteobacteria bacterium]
MPRQDRFWLLVGLSAFLHLALGAAGLALRPAPLIDLEQKPIVAKLVRLGEKRPEHLLPRKEEPPPSSGQPEAAPVPAPPGPAPTPAPAAPARPSPPRPATAPPRGARTDALASALSRLKREPVRGSAGGDPSGDPLGDSSDGEAGDRYLALAQRALHETYRIPSTINERDLLHLRATVILYLLPDGTVTRWSFESRSGNGAFDDALERAIRQARLPPPPAELRERYRSQGLGVRFVP